MNITQLTYFRQVARNQHLLKAADALYVSPSTISVSIKKLEDEMGTPLFDRVGRNMQLNERGRLLLPYVETALDALEQGKLALDHAMYDRGNELAFSLKDIAYYDATLQALLDQWPGLSLRHCDMDADDRGNLLWEMDLEVMFTAKDLSQNRMLQSCVVYRDPYCLAVPKTHWLAEREVCSLEDLTDVLFLMRPADNYFQSCVDVILAEHGFRPRATLELGYTLRSSLGQALSGACITTENCMTTSIFANFKRVAVRELAGRTYDVRAYWKQGSKLSGPARTLIELMRQTTDQPGALDE